MYIFHLSDFRLRSWLFIYLILLIDHYTSFVPFRSIFVHILERVALLEHVY